VQRHEDRDPSDHLPFLMRRLLLVLVLGCGSAPGPRPTPPPPAPHGPQPLETINLVTTASSAPLATGQIYLLKASGSVTVGARRQDAEWAFADGAAPDDLVAETDVGIDVGRKRVLPATGRKPSPPTDERLKWFGPYQPDHVYYLLVTGTGAPLSLRLITAGPAAGALTVAVYRLTPAPPAIGAPLETVMVPAREKVMVHSAYKPAPNAIHLLQAVGEVQVGGPGAMGDAEFHDYKADGRGFNEGEAGVDFGVGVDQAEIGAPGAPTTGSQHPQRHLKWGAFRLDHTYYMLHAGTGDAIGLNYHDSGGKTGIYKDNEGFLPVSIFPVP
jgi:hypothetical protein